MKRASLKRNALWALVGNVIYAGTQWGILIVLAKMLAPDAVGEFALGLAISAPIFGFANLQLRAIQASDVRTEWATSNYVALRIITSALALLAIFVIVQVQGYARNTTVVILLLAVAKTVESLADILYGILQKHEDLRRVSLSLIQRGVIGLGFMAVAIASTGSIAVGTVALAVAWALVLGYYDINNVKALDGSRTLPWSDSEAFRPSVLLGLARTALPMGVVIGLNSLTQNVPRYFVAESLGNAALGYYSAISYILAAVTVVVSAMGQAVTPRLAAYYVHDVAAYVRLILKALSAAFAVGCAGVLVALFWGREILTLLYQKEYGEYASVFAWIMVNAALFGCVSVLGVAITAARRFRAQALVSLGMVLISVAACAILVPTRGLDGAAVAGVVALAFKFAFQAIHLCVLARARMGAAT